MIYCPKCGKENPDDVAFCGYCGTNLKTLEGKIKEQKIERNTTRVVLAMVFGILGIMDGVAAIYQINEIAGKAWLALGIFVFSICGIFGGFVKNPKGSGVILIISGTIIFIATMFLWPTAQISILTGIVFILAGIHALAPPKFFSV